MNVCRRKKEKKSAEHDGEIERDSAIAYVFKIYKRKSVRGWGMGGGFGQLRGKYDLSK